MLLFAHHHRVMDRYKQLLRAEHPVFITGRESTAEKDEAAARFMEGKTDLCCVSLRAGGGPEPAESLLRGVWGIGLVSRRAYPGRGPGPPHGPKGFRPVLLHGLFLRVRRADAGGPGAEGEPVCAADGGRDAQQEQTLLMQVEARAYVRQIAQRLLQARGAAGAG